LYSNDELSYQASTRANANLKQLLLAHSCMREVCFDSYFTTMLYWQKHDNREENGKNDSTNCNLFKKEVLD
jgi:hypothetical protein